MIRQIFITLLFFFGPTILMMVIRHFVLLLHIMRRRNRYRGGPEIIDVTPVAPGSAPRWFVVVSMLIGFACAWLAWWALADQPATPMRYQPAHVDSAGKIIAGKWQPRQ